MNIEQVHVEIQNIDIISRIVHLVQFNCISASYAIAFTGPSF